MDSNNNLTMKKIFVSALVALCGFTASYAQEASFLSNNHCLYRISQESQNQKCLLLPVQEDAEMANIKVIANNKQVKAFNVKLAKDHVDYFVPLYMDEFAGLKGLALDIHVNGDYSKEGLNALTCWKEMKFSDAFDMKNREQYRPDYHHTPAYGWMNDPNGMFYKDGVWHLCYQFNPYGSQWENLSWGHSTSTDLINWKAEPTALEPDALGMMFSGCCVVDKNNTAGFGKDAIVALYTTAGARQTQSLAYSTDGGKTFTKYADNPIITSNVPDFRDPHVFWNAEAGFWNMILAAGQQMSIYSSKDLKEWKHESDFGAEYGNHGGVWECPDLMKMNVKGTNKDKWMLICNINPGGPFGGSATQYFIGQFDGHKFTCEDEPSETKWMDYGKDHYATVTFDNAPDGRRCAIAWMSNWQYANQVPTKQFRSANSIVRDLGLFEYKGETYCSITPAKEMLAARGARVSQPTEACEIVVTVKGDAQITLRNAKGERVVMTYDDEEETFDMDRRRSGNSSFSDAFPVATSSPTYGKVRQLRIFVDRCSVEAFDGDGKMCMTNLVFPSTPYDKIIVKGKAKAAIYKIKTQN